ncbi:MAG: CAP domain-containing protein [Rubrivivax sp.]
MPLPTRFTLQRLAAALALVAAAQSASAAGAGEAFTRQLARLINEYRAHHGLAPLAAAEDLDRIADEHSGAMADVKRLSHEGFRSRLQRTRSSLCVENVAWNYRTPEALLDGWRASPAHHRNLLEPDVTRMGLATATRYVTFFACR